MPGVPTVQVRLPDGRMMAIAEYGDPAGLPVLYFHGFPACRLEAGLIGDLPVRLLALDRPGYGGSTPKPGRTLLDWPQDVAHVADQLGLDTLHLVGLSGGGPYAAVCAAVLGSQGAVLVAGLSGAAGLRRAGRVGWDRRADPLRAAARPGRDAVSAGTDAGAAASLLHPPHGGPRLIARRRRRPSPRRCVTG